MNPTPHPAQCPRCGAPLPADGASCPACLLRQAFPTPPLDQGRRAAPTLDELAPHFPQLELEALIGRGAMGAVYRARQRSLGRAVALKVLAPELCERAGFLERFEREALRDGVLESSEVLDLVSQLCAASEYEHARGVVHRDISRRTCCWSAAVG